MAASGTPSPPWPVPAAAQRHPRLALLALCLLLWLPGFFTLPPTDRDEARFVQATKQMLETGDYVRIMNGTTPRLKKPIGIYWAQLPFAAAARAAGLAQDNPVWPYRLASLLGALIAVLATRSLALALGAEPATALAAAAILAATALLTAEAHIAKTDAALCGAITTCLWIWAEARRAPISRTLALGFWAALAASILIKGPIGPMVLGLGMLASTWWPQERAAWRRLYPLSGVALTAVLVLPWLIAIMRATGGAFLAESAGHDLAGKLAGGQEGHGAPFGLHSALLPLLFFPSAVPLARGLLLAGRRWRDPAIRFLLCVILPAWLVFEATPTKLPHYPLPLYPLLAVLAAMGVARAAGLAPRTRRILWISLGLAGLAVVIAAMAFASRAGLPANVAGAGALFLVLCLAASLLLGAIVPLTGIAFGGAFYAGVIGWALPQAAPLWVSPRLTAAFDQTLGDRTALGSDIAVLGYAEPSLMFLAGTQTSFLSDPEQAVSALRQGGIRAIAVESRAEAGFLLASAAGGLNLHRGTTVEGFNYGNGKRVSLTLYTP